MHRGGSPFCDWLYITRRLYYIDNCPVTKADQRSPGVCGDDMESSLLGANHKKRHYRTYFLLLDLSSSGCQIRYHGVQCREFNCFTLLSVLLNVLLKCASEVVFLAGLHNASMLRVRSCSLSRQALGLRVLHVGATAYTKPAIGASAARYRFSHRSSR